MSGCQVGEQLCQQSMQGLTWFGELLGGEVCPGPRAQPGCLCRAFAPGPRSASLSPGGKVLEAPYPRPCQNELSPASSHFCASGGLAKVAGTGPRGVLGVSLLRLCLPAVSPHRDGTWSRAQFRAPRDTEATCRGLAGHSKSPWMLLSAASLTAEI